MVDYEKKYKDAMGMAEEIIRYYKEHNRGDENSIEDLEGIFPELKESEDEKIRKALIKGVECCKASGWTNFGNNVDIDVVLAWLEKQGNEPAWCHHKVDLSDCTEEYRKAYYDGWNNCNQQHSQCDADKNDVIKCLINGMRFYYEDNKDATWGTDKWSMPVKHIIDVLEKQDNQKPTEPKPKFKVGDWVVYECGEDSATLQIKDIVYGTYEFTDDSTLNVVDEDSLRLWSIKDAKDGDVLASDNSIFIFQEEYIAEKPVAYCGLMNGLFVKGENACWTNEKCHPATKEQRDLLFKRVNAAGYEWDDDKKELKKIHVIDDGKAEMDYCFTKMMAGEKVSPAWSEEDKNFMYDTLSNLTELKDRYGEVYGNVGKCIDWLKSIKDRVQPQPKQEWSEKDEEMCQETIDWFEKKCFPYALEEENPARESIKWLKSLKNRLPLVKNC